MYILWIAIYILLYKFLTNVIRYFQVKRYMNRYLKWLHENGKVKFFVAEDKAIVKRLINRASVNDARVGYAEPLGYGQISRGMASVLENYPSNMASMAPLMVRMFEEALGVYKLRCFETFSPLYWIEFVIFLPKNLLVYLGVKSENISVKILQIIWWFVSVLAGTLGILYKDQFKSFIDKFVEQLFK